jgi:hypothetical protein
LPPVVLSELLSDPRLPRDVRDVVLRLPLLEILDGYWERDHDVELVTRDADFRHFVRLARLRLLPSAPR